MYTLGICNDDTASACMFRDGRLISAVSEERFSRIKMDNSFPRRSIDFVLSEAGKNLQDIDQVAYAWSKGFPEDALENYIERSFQISHSGDLRAQASFQAKIREDVKRDRFKRAEFEEWIDKNKHQIQNYQSFYHHEAHALSATLLSPFDHAVCLTADGRGDFEAITAWIFNRSNSQPLRKIYTSTACDSLGFFYGRITGLLGFKPCRHEGKVTGLAASGDRYRAIDLMRKMIDFEDGSIVAKISDYYEPFYTVYSRPLLDEIARYSKEDIAAAAQFHLENLLQKLTQSIYERHALPAMPLAVAGGVFGNVRLNQVLKELPCVTSMFVQPQMGDGGLCLGAAAGAQHQCEIRIQSLQDLYLGPDVSIGQVDHLSAVFPDLQFIQPDDLLEFVVNELKASNVVGLVRGRMEFGPRALCHRSIIYKASDQSSNDWLNKRMNRTEFMPFAPVMTMNQARKAFDQFSESDITLKFMTSTMNANAFFVSRCPAVSHVDHTARPQIIDSKEDPFMHSLLCRWEELTGEIALINTSFNAHEEPIVCDVADALKGLEAGMVDTVVLERLIVKRMF